MPVKGKPCSESTKLKISQKNKGRKVSQETRQKLSEKGKNRIHSKEAIEKRRLKVLGMKLTKEQKKKISIAISIPIYQYDQDLKFIRSWNSMTEAAKELNLNINCISLCCRNKLKKAGKFIFRKELITTIKPLI